MSFNTFMTDLVSSCQEAQQAAKEVHACFVHENALNPDTDPSISDKSIIGNSLVEMKEE